jgi:flavin-dependent dehydrogenase
MGRLASETVYDKTAGGGWISIGDAAYAADPLSGKGIEFAVESAEVAAVALSGTQSGPALTAYQGWVENHVHCQSEEAAIHRGS